MSVTLVVAAAQAALRRSNGRDEGVQLDHTQLGNRSHAAGRLQVGTVTVRLSQD